MKNRKATMVHASMFFVIVSVFQLSVIRSNRVSKGSYFIELGDAQDEGSHQNLGTTVFSENFHKCSLVESCQYLSLNTNTNKYTQISNEDDVPKNLTGFKIWKKVTPEGNTGFSVSFKYLFFSLYDFKQIFMLKSRGACTRLRQEGKCWC